MGSKAETRNYPQPYDRVFTAFQRALELGEYKVRLADVQQGRFNASPPPSMFSWGLTMEARLGSGPQGTQVWVQVEQPGLVSGDAAKKLAQLWDLFQQVLTGVEPQIDYAARARKHRRAGWAVLVFAVLMAIGFVGAAIDYFLNFEQRSPAFFILLAVATLFGSIGKSRLDLAKAALAKAATQGDSAPPRQPVPPIR